MCTDGDGTAGSYTEALAMIAAGLDYLNLAAASGEVDESQYGEVLLSLQAAESKHAATRAAFLSRFDAAGCHDSDGYQSSSSWLAAKIGVSRSAAKGQVRRMRNLRDRSRLAAAMSEGWLSESAADSIVTWTKPLPAEQWDGADKLLLDAIQAGAHHDDVHLLAVAAVEGWRAQRPDPDDPDDGFDDRYVRLSTTMDNVGRLTGNLTAEGAAAVQAVLESLGKKRGKEDTRTQEQRWHDALQEACELLIGAKMVPGRAGADTRVDVHIPFSQLCQMDGVTVLEEAWLQAKAGEHGWLLGKDAEVAACDALIVPLVTAAPDWPVMTEMVFLVLDALGKHGGTSEAADERPPLPLPPEAWQALMYAMGRLAIKFVSGPGAIASVLRTGLLPAPFNTRNVPLDVGYSDHIPEPIRRAVIARARHCEWPGGCDRPPSACDVHHLIHKKDGGPTSVTGCGLFCDFHHDVCIHRWGWQVEFQADGTVTAVGPDGQVIRGHPPPSRARLTRRPRRRARSRAVRRAARRHPSHCRSARC